MSILSAEALMKYMINLDIQYGCYDKLQNKCISGNEWDNYQWNYFKKNFMILSSKLLEKYKFGTCFDSSWMIFYKLKEMRYDGVSCILYEWGRSNGCHMTIIYKNKFSKLWYWFEYSWGLLRGIHGGYINRENIIKLIRDTAIKENKITTFKSFNINFDLSFTNGKDMINYEEWYKEIYIQNR